MTNGTGTTGDYYRLLGISPEATRAEIRAAYRGKVRLFHPDLVAGETEDPRQAATEMTALLNNAYECLSDPNRRAAYDISNRAETASMRRPSSVLLAVSPRTPRCEVIPGDTVDLTLDVRADHPPGGDGLRIRGVDRSMAAASTVTILTERRARVEMRMDTSKLEAHRIFHIPIVVTWGKGTGTATLEVRTTELRRAGFTRRLAEDNRHPPPAAIGRDAQGAGCVTWPPSAWGA